MPSQSTLNEVPRGSNNAGRYLNLPIILASTSPPVDDSAPSMTADFRNRLSPKKRKKKNNKRKEENLVSKNFVPRVSDLSLPSFSPLTRPSIAAVPSGKNNPRCVQRGVKKRSPLNGITILTRNRTKSIKT